jgi:hypothetical protein
MSFVKYLNPNDVINMNKRERIKYISEKLIKKEINYVADNDIYLKEFMEILREENNEEYYNLLYKVIDIYHYINLRDFKEELKTYDLCLGFMKRNGNDILYVPKKHKNKEMCQIAMQTTPICIFNVPKKFREHENYMNLIDCSMSKDYAFSFKTILKFIPSKYVTKEHCSEITKKYGYALKYIPKKFLDKQMCMDAYLNSNWECIHCIPEEYLTYKMCISSIDKFGFVFSHIPKKFIKKEICIIVANNRIWELINFPPKYNNLIFHYKFIIKPKNNYYNKNIKYIIYIIYSPNNQKKYMKNLSYYTF